MKNFIEIIHKIAGKKIMVVGDLMLDTFVYGDVNRISPESPVPVLTIRRENKMLGGAGNVISNLAGLKAVPVVHCVIGDDAAGAQAKGIAAAFGADVSGILVDPFRPTTLKTRFLARSQQLLRTDFEKTAALSPEQETAMISNINASLADCGAVILSDYGKGVLSAGLLQKIIAAANEAGLPVLVDPKGHDYSIYRGASVVTPNRKELSDATGGMPTVEDSDIVEAAEKVVSECGIDAVVATRSEDGMTIVRRKGAGNDFQQPLHMKTEALEVFDVSGAGDTVIATIAAAMAAGAPLPEAATLANVAGGIVVGKVGTTPIHAHEMIEALEGREESLDARTVGDMALADRARQARIANWDAAVELVHKWRAKGLKVGLTNGCFDILHYGHVNYLNHARNKCDRLIVAMNHDLSVKVLKGPERPVNDEVARATVLGALGAVDLVVLFGATEKGQDNTPCALISRLQPDIYFKGGDYTIEQLPEAAIVQGYGGEVAIMNLYEGYSTTGTIQKMRQV